MAPWCRGRIPGDGRAQQHRWGENKFKHHVDISENTRRYNITFGLCFVGCLYSSPGRHSGDLPVYISGKPDPRAIIAFQEVFGLSSNIKRICDILAQVIDVSKKLSS